MMTPMKKLLRRSVLLSALVFLGVPSWPAQTQTGTPAATQLPSAREVIDRFAEVTKRKALIEKTKSKHEKGKFLMPAFGLEGAMESWSTKPDRHLTVVEMAAMGKVTTGYDGQVAWSMHPMMGPRILKGAELLQNKLEASYDADLKTSPLIESIQTVGREIFEGKDCYKVQVVAKPLEGMDSEKTREVRTSFEFYEVGSGLLAGLKGKQEGEMGGGPYTAVVSDYKDFGGYLLATKTVMKAGGQEFTVTVDSVDFDTATDEIFALPKEVQAKLESEAKKPAPQPEPKPQ